ncbi:MAG: hypothetical protein Q7S45_01000 [Candidatus Curtissbacteria bacterium]|nr:hypothetical protein [Candidatus Curtissbacteria bacterium]
MRNLILLIIIVVLAGAGYFAFQKLSSTQTPTPAPAQTVPSKITSEQAVASVKNLPEIQDYLKRVPNGKIEVDSGDESEYSVHVYEIKDGHTATFNWYSVNIKDGKVKPQFPQ